MSVPTLPPAPPSRPAEQTNGMAVAGFVCGLGGAVFGLIPLTAIFALAGGVCGIVFGLIGYRRDTGRGLATAGIILGSLAVLLAMYGFSVLADVADQLEQIGS